MFAVQAMNHYVFLSLTNYKSSVHLHALYSPLILSTDHELIPARNASLAAMQGSTSASNGLYYPT
jgi:hypothetical protein